YEALSYTWGSDIIPEDITIGEQFKLKVRPNLHTALRYLKVPNRDLFLWVDAICINQSDSQEKSDQV
ncbi:heterokaryon incompatibility, partial [Bisporella sp. PMI_857]